jgi:putative iron-dependent peroxidase
MMKNTPYPQGVDTPMTSSAIFMVATLAPGEDAAQKVRSWCADIAGLVRAVGKRVPDGNLS